MTRQTNLFKSILGAAIMTSVIAADATAAERLLVVGDATWGAWSLDRTSVMVKDPVNPDIFRYTGWLHADKEFKFLAQTSWDREEYRNAGPDPYTITDLAYSNNGSVPDYKFKVAESANYVITCDLSTMKISIGKSDYTKAPILHNVLYLVGDATPGGWNLSEALPLAQDSSDPMHFSGEVMLNPGIFKIATNPYGGYNEQKFYFRHPEDQGKISEDATDDRQWTISKTGLYKVDVNLENSSISITETSQIPVLGHLKDWTRDGNDILINAENGILRLTPYNDYVVKVFPRLHGDAIAERRSISVAATPHGAFAAEEKDDYIEFSTNGITLRVARNDCRLTFTDKAGHIVLKEASGLDNSRQPRTATFEAMGDEAFYGGGYNGKRINHDGTTLTMNNRQTGGWDSTWDAPHNICIPFVVSTEGYGLLFDDHYRNARLTPSSKGTTYNSNSTTPIAYYYVGSADGGMASVLENYTFLTGRQELPPYWALGYMTSRYGYRTQQEAENAVASVKEAGLPLDAIIFDLYWQGAGNNGMGNLDWYKPNFPDAEKMMAGFAEKGVKTICITEPFFTSDSRNYSLLKEKGYFADDDVSRMEWLGSSKVGLIDSSDPEAMDWMWNYYKMRTEEGVGGWWLDLGEPESHDDDSRHKGGSVAQIHNEFGDLWTARVYKGYKEDFPNVRPFLMPRAGTAGMQRYSTFPWSGDIKRSYNGLAAQIPALLSSGMSGVAYMGSDVGGFNADGVGTDPELYLRWVEMATFSPMMRTHSPERPEPYLPEYADVLPDVRRFINLRYSYLPYTYTLAWENATKGTPLARPLNFHDSMEALPSPSGCTDQYLWGRDLMVAPMVTPGKSRHIVFPQGRWVDLNATANVYAGGTTIEYDTPLGKLPHFGREGAFLPRFTQQAYTSTSDIDNSRISVTYLAGPSGSRSGETDRCTMFEDDRLSTTSLQDNEYLTTVFEGKEIPGGTAISVTHNGKYPGMPAERTLTLVIPGYASRIDGIKCAGTDLQHIGNQTDFATSETDAYCLGDDNTLYIRKTLPTEGTTSFNIAGRSESGVSAIGNEVITLAYSATTGMISYSIPTGSTEATLTIAGIDGTVLNQYEDLIADAAVGQLPAGNMPTGIYIARLSLRLPSGQYDSRTLKIYSRQ